ncbi:MAG: hypothetical protein WC661_14915 [Opitutaceae bacterium]|jgi:hypothetical protein
MRFFLLWLLLGSAVWAAGVQAGMSREEVEAALGRPKAVLQNKTRQVLLYPDGGRVELSDGRVVYSTKVPVGPGTPAPEPVALPATVAPGPVPPVPADDELAVHEQAGHQRMLEKSLEEMTRAHTQRGVVPVADPAGFWGGLLLTSFAQLLAAVVVLKFAFSWAEVHADWGQMWIPALADTVATMLVRCLAYVFWGATELFQMDNALAFLVLMWVLMKTTHACTWPRAIGVAVTTKMVGMGVRLLLGACVAHVFG